MIDDSNCNNPWDETDEIFFKLEEEVIDISCKMVLLIVILEKKFGPFREVGGSNIEVVSDRKSKDNEDPEKD
jgi:hypothetical protein